MSLPQPISDYLSKISASSVVLSRAAWFFDLAEDLLPEGEHVNRLFVSEYVDNEGARVWENIWMFSDNYALEAERFMSEENLDCICLKDNLGYYRIAATNYTPPAEASDRSRINVVLSFRTNGQLPGVYGGELKASGGNCNYLYSIIKDVYMPNMQPG